MTRRTTMRLSVGFGRHRAVAMAQHARRQRLVGRLAQHQERAFGRHGLERQVHDAVEDVGQRLGAEQRPADFRQQPDELAVAHRRRRRSAIDRLEDRARAFGNLVLLGEQLLLGDVLLEHERDLAEPDRRPGRHGHLVEHLRRR